MPEEGTLSEKKKSSLDDTVACGETVSAVLTNAETGEKKFIGGFKFKIEVKITNLQTGEVHVYEAKR